MRKNKSSAKPCVRFPSYIYVHIMFGVSIYVHINKKVFFGSSIKHGTAFTFGRSERKT